MSGSPGNEDWGVPARVCGQNAILSSTFLRGLIPRRKVLDLSGGLRDDLVRMPDENPSIGIILCKSKDKTIVEYALRESNKPIGVATYDSYGLTE